MLFISANTVDDTSWKGDRTVWLHDLVLTGSLLQLLYHCAALQIIASYASCAIGSGLLMITLTSVSRPCPISPNFFAAYSVLGQRCNSVLSNNGLSGHSAEVGQAVQA